MPQSLYSPLFPAGTVPTLPFPSAPREASPQSSPTHPAEVPAPHQEPWGPSLPPPLITPCSVPALPSWAGGDRVHHHPVQLHVQQQLRGRNEQEAHPHHHHPGDKRVSGCQSRGGHCGGAGVPWEGVLPCREHPQGKGTWQSATAPARSRGKALLCWLGKGLARRYQEPSPASASPPAARAFLCPWCSSCPRKLLLRGSLHPVPRGGSVAS